MTELESGISKVLLFVVDVFFVGFLFFRGGVGIDSLSIYHLSLLGSEASPSPNYP